jgi:hypothetical protein
LGFKRGESNLDESARKWGLADEPFEITRQKGRQRAMLSKWLAAAPSASVRKHCGEFYRREIVFRR